jgi:hypothetical protein
MHDDGPDGHFIQARCFPRQAQRLAHEMIIRVSQ